MRRPTFIAEQARHARGPLGRLIAFIMARETWATNRAAIDALEVQTHDQILDLGCGPGRALEALAVRATNGRVVGADPSELMVEIAAGRMRCLIRAGRVDVTVAGVEKLPFGTASFDKVLCVHVIYFWPDLDAGLRELARVVKPGGRLVLVFRDGADPTGAQTFPAEVYRFRTLTEVRHALDCAGFDVLEAEVRTPVRLIARCRGATAEAS